MDSMTAFAMGQANIGKEHMVFDWDRAARRIKETGAENASAGLSGDWMWTGGDILEDGEIPEVSYTYLSSTWAVPELCIDGIVEPCYRMQSEVPDWDEDTFWPDSARAILGIERGEQP